MPAPTNVTRYRGAEMLFLECVCCMMNKMTSAFERRMVRNLTKRKLVLELVLLTNLVAFCYCADADHPRCAAFYEQIPQDWNSVDDPDHLYLQMFLTNLSANRQAITTLESTFTVTVKTDTRTSDFTTEIVSDQKDHKCLRKVVVDKTVDNLNSSKYSKNGYDGDFVAINSSVDIETPVNHIFFKDFGLQTQIKELPGYPLTPERNIARVIPPASDTVIRDTFCVDPYEWYDFFVWGDLGTYSDWLNGKDGEEKKTFAMERLRVYEAEDENGVKWIWFCIRTKSGAETSLYCNDVSDFMPLFLSRKNKNGKLVEFRCAKWVSVNNVYYPHEYESSLFLPDGNLVVGKKISTSNIKINQSVNPAVFTVKSLKMPDGSLLVDQTQQKIFRFKRGKPVFFADFYSKDFKLDPPEKMREGNKFRISFVVLGFVLLAVGVLLKFRLRVVNAD